MATAQDVRDISILYAGQTMRQNGDFQRRARAGGITEIKQMRDDERGLPDLRTPTSMVK